MKLKLLTVILLLGLLFYGTTAIANEDHVEEAGEHEAMDHCDTPTTEITIEGGKDNAIAYGEKEYQVPLDTCVEVIFANLAIDEHDISIDEVHDVMGEVHIHLENNTDGHDADGVKSMNIQTPNEDTEFEIYCSVSGHKNAGMVAILVVGSGNALLPGFGFYSLFVGLTALVIISKKKN